MAVIKLNLKDLNKLSGFEIEKEELMQRLPLLGCDIEGIDGDYVYVEFFPNRPDLYSVEGVARALRNFFGFKKGLREYKLLPPKTYIKVDESVEKIRPYVVSCEVENVRLNHEFIQELMDLQEDLHWVLGRDRKKVSIGVHDPSRVKPPFRYTALIDRDIKFVPLGMEEEMSPVQILEKHPKGKDYAHIISGHDKYPFILDSEGNVLSLPPVINGELTKVSEKTEKLFVDITGTDFDLISKALNILSTAFLERGFVVYQVEVRYKNKTVITPDYTPEEKDISLDYVNNILGLSISGEEAVEALERMGYGAFSAGNSLKVEIPAYRSDIFHPVDIVEDIAIGYGYENFDAKLPDIATTGEEDSLEEKCRKLRKLLVGYSLSEVMSLMLSNEKENFESMFVEGEAVTIKNPISEDHTIVRTSLLPSLLNVLRINRHHELPQKIFEIGDILIPYKELPEGAKAERHLAIVLIHSKAGFTEIKSIAEALMRDLGLEYKIEAEEHGSFILGRCARIVAGGKPAGYFGELRPEVIIAFDLEYPVVAMEINVEQI